MSPVRHKRAIFLPLLASFTPYFFDSGPLGGCEGSKLRKTWYCFFLAFSHVVRLSQTDLEKSKQPQVKYNNAGGTSQRVETEVIKREQIAIQNNIYCKKAKGERQHTRFKIYKNPKFWLRKIIGSTNKTLEWFTARTARQYTVPGGVIV